MSMQGLGCHLASASLAISKSVYCTEGLYTPALGGPQKARPKASFTAAYASSYFTGPEYLRKANA